MNKQTKVLLKQAAYYIKKAEFEKQSAFKGKNMAKALEGVKKGWNRLWGNGGKTKMPVDTGLNYDVPQRLSDFRGEVPYNQLLPPDKDFADAVLRAKSDALNVSSRYDIDSDPNIIGRARLEDDWLKAWKNLAAKQEDLPADSFFRQGPPLTENDFLNFARRARYDYLTSGIESLKAREPYFREGNMMDKYNRYMQDWRRWRDEYPEIEGNWVPHTNGWKDYWDGQVPGRFANYLEDLHNPRFVPYKDTPANLLRPSESQQFDYEALRRAFQTDGAPSQPLTPAQRGQGTLDEGINWLRNQK